jgi:DNA-binding CsgD family transcriptional regulator
VVGFSHREFADALAVVNAAAVLLDRSTPFSRRFLHLLARLVPGPVLGYREREVGSHRLLIDCNTAPCAPPAVVTAAAARLCGEHPLSIRRVAHARGAHRISDVVSGPGLHRLDYFREVLAPMGVEHQIRLWLPAPRGVARYLFINRGLDDGDFEDHERDLLDLLGPTLAASRERWGGAAGGPVLDGLTARESEILTLVARGKTNPEIAAELVLSPNTVRKHLENAFQKLGVHTRAEAVAHLFTQPDR